MTYWIADLCSNWGGDLSIARDMIAAAAEADFDAVKVQAIRPMAMWRPGDPRIKDHANLELTWREIGMLWDEAQAHELDFGVSVFALSDVYEAASRSDFVKVASCESMWWPLVNAVANSGADWMISTPPGWRCPIDDETFAKNLACRMHCIPQYPCPPHDAHLVCLDEIREDLARIAPEAKVGYSDHTASVSVVADAVAWYGAEVVEVHWESPLESAEDPHSWDEYDIEALRCTVDTIRLSGGDEHEAAVQHRIGFWCDMARDDEGWRK